MNPQEFRDLSSGHALRALSPEEEQTFGAALAAHPEWQQIVDEDLAVAAGLGRSLPEVPPRPELRDQILGAIDAVPQVVASLSEGGADPEPASAGGEDQPTPRRAWRVGAFALAASVILFTLVLFGPNMLESFAPKAPAIVALQEIESAPDAGSQTAKVGDATATLHWSDAQGRAVLVAKNMAPAEKGEDYELWIVRGEKATSLGLMRPSEGEDTMFVTDSFASGDVVAVTVEPAGGSPTGKPTSQPILAIATA
ncbi:anti-sigma factor [Leucobacter coleopterorum]|uniref:Regulator of SigK n=1 Tax=Leucobacter coleopterorum TaxID=2714933 RepID=A0ABX6JVU2_9MICO|nr:anti-sigma factor [Leucobacter coleopterorum]QIM17693.1 anti-sigma factor [Leucobacter coleopterorum]